MGKISDKNTRTLITIPKELKKQLEQLAKKDNRSFNNLVITVLSNYVADSSHDWSHESSRQSFKNSFIAAAVSFL